MNPLLAQVSNELQAAIESAYPDAEYRAQLESTLEFSDQQFGDVASSIALRLAAQLQLSPRQVAEAIMVHLGTPEVTDVIAHVEVAGPGYINMRLQPSLLTQALTQTAHFTAEVKPQIEGIGEGKTVVMDYSHPNIGKPMGVHHLLSTILGDALKRSLRQAGYMVIADNFIGDLGTQFGKLIWAVKQWGDTTKIQADPISELQKLYVQFHIEADKDVALDDAGRAEYLKLEQGDEQNRALWHKIVAWSKAEIQPIYDALGVEFDHMHGESFYEDKMEPILARGEQEGAFTYSEGALVCMSDNPDQPPAILRKRDGATLYLTRDLARIAYWQKIWQPDTMIVVVDQAQHFAQTQLYEVAHKLNLTAAELVQVNFGRMRFADGSMSTRKGNILLLSDLIDEAKQRAKSLVVQKATHLDAQEQEQNAEILAIDSIKYNILSQNRQSDITFDWDTMLNFEGNSAPYLMYSIVRARSVLDKATAEGISTLGDDSLYVWEQSTERELVLLLSQYVQIVQQSLRDYKPSHIATYMFSLAQKYNNLYNNLPILTAPTAEKHARLTITQAVDAVLTHAADCLGLVVPNKM